MTRLSIAQRVLACSLVSFASAPAWAQDPPPTPREQAQQLYDQSKKAFKRNTLAGFQDAKDKLEKCIKVDKGFADCHKLLGATYGQLGDGIGGAHQYELFLDLAPNDPAAPKVRALLKAFHGTTANVSDP